MIALFVALGAAVGAPARYLTDRAVQSVHTTVFPWGTLVVNVVASLVFGVVLGAAGHLDGDVQALLTTGFCGALSTYSTFSYETVRLATGGATAAAGSTGSLRTERLLAAGNIVASVVAGLGAATIGFALGGLA